MIRQKSSRKHSLNGRQNTQHHFTLRLARHLESSLGSSKTRLFSCCSSHTSADDGGYKAGTHGRTHHTNPHHHITICLHIVPFLCMCNNSVSQWLCAQCLGPMLSCVCLLSAHIHREERYAAPLKLSNFTFKTVCR